MDLTKDVIFDRPVRFLGTYDQILDVGNLFANFLMAINVNTDFGQPDEIIIVVMESFYYINAINCSIGSTQVFEQLNISKANELLPSLIGHGLSYLAPVIWFSDTCIIENNLAKILFNKGELTNNIQKYENMTVWKSYISVQFTPLLEVFNQTTLKHQRLKTILDFWGKNIFPKFDIAKQTDLEFNWKIMSDTRYIVSIKYRNLAK